MGDLKAKMMRKLIPLVSPYLTRLPGVRAKVRERSPRSARAINQRSFEVGPVPKRWPPALEFAAIAQMDSTRLLRSTVVKNWKLIGLTSMLSIVAFASSVLISWALGRALDAGIDRGLTTDLLPGLALLIGVIVMRMLGLAAEPFLIVTSMRAGVGWSLAMIRHVAGVRAGGRAAMPSGEIVAAVTTDTHKLGQMLYAIPELIAGVFSFGLTVALMCTINVTLGLVVAIGLPISIGLMTFLIAPLQKRLNAQREERGKLTTLASDAVVGLRVLRGVGGEKIYMKRYALQSEKVCQTGIRAAALQAFLRGLTSAVPGVFTAAIVGGGLWEVLHGAMTYGELVSFYGYTAFLVVPVTAAASFLQFYTDAKIAADRIARVMAIEPLTSNRAVDRALADARARRHAVGKANGRPFPTEYDWGSAYLRDCRDGVEIRPGIHTAIVSAAPEVAAELVERLARVDDADAASARWEGSSPVPLTAFDLDEVRHGVVLSDAIAQLFQGRLRSNLEGNNAAWPLPRTVGRQMADTGDGAGVANRDHKVNPVAIADRTLMLGMIAADASDIVDSVEDGLDGYIAERGRSLSGGQRQRVALARAILTEAPVLILVEPTSAVDSHTESRIAQRLHRERRGRTTVIVSASPIMLGEVDEVVFIDADGHELARGTHDALLNDSRYYDVVHRESGAESTQGKGIS
ncbi:ABC transporter ATP-binding protein [Trueperella pyogenes]|uniref:ABC transporter ATP-binding protein n=1 Tax=Trueperella pyogenes TaxID=1661 RepID=UPI0024C07E55|nr:ABC transporter ATP-binding protein [Trueperella pyogenes]WHU56179.1 ABC transporter ATP-binding protein [Trueperella pyogenes]